MKFITQQIGLKDYHFKRIPVKLRYKQNKIQKTEKCKRQREYYEKAEHTEVLQVEGKQDWKHCLKTQGHRAKNFF